MIACMHECMHAHTHTYTYTHTHTHIHTYNHIKKVLPGWCGKCVCVCASDRHGYQWPARSWVCVKRSGPVRIRIIPGAHLSFLCISESPMVLRRTSTDTGLPSRQIAPSWQKTELRQCIAEPGLFNHFVCSKLQGKCVYCIQGKCKVNSILWCLG